MNRLFQTFCLLIAPVLASAADGSLSFTPPATDYSVIFLGNIFGIVDGVLHGSGSQILGSMFGVFNAAVLAIGGIIIMYTLMVSTMNTAHEGQMLGQKWSSIWVPVRSAIGLALLIPKASGYCLMQIFVMWIVVQGVGAADKVWDAALSYLNRGGVIIQAQTNPTEGLTKASTPSSGIAIGAETILAGQVCMFGLQKQLEAQREQYLRNKGDGGGPCYGTPSPNMKSFCDTAVPDFINSVNIVSKQSSSPKGQTSFSLTMPNFEQSSIYSSLNGICGQLNWNAFSADSLNKVKNNIKSISDDDLNTASMSRAIAIQQMYLDLAMVAQVMIGNDPEFKAPSSGPNPTPSNDFSPMADQQFGVPHVRGGGVCSSGTPSGECTLWGAATGTGGSALFIGSEFQNALNDYNGIMKPTLNLVSQSDQADSANASRAFIQDASEQGWLMAGSYFFDLVRLNSQALGTADSVDTNTGLNTSTFDVRTIGEPYGGSATQVQCQGKYAILCVWVKNPDKIYAIQRIINGTEAKGMQPLGFPNLNSTNRQVIDGIASSTVYGYLNNASLLQLPGQPGQKPLQFANLVNINVDTSTYYLPHGDFECGEVKILFFKFCLGKLLGEIFYNAIFRYIYNFFLSLFQNFINQVIMAFLQVPLQGMAAIFTQGVTIISQPGINPIVALANMGTYYINFAGQIWLMLIEMSVISAIIPIFGIFIFALLSLGMPIILAWVGVMVTVGFVTAYYVPILPYMMFIFGVIAWLMAVIEAMVAAPIVALGVTHPEGHEAFGKGEQAIMILMNVFLRPSMMIIGYVAAIALSYVGVWILNAGFDHAIGFMQGSTSFGTSGSTSWSAGWSAAENAAPDTSWTSWYGSGISAPGAGTVTGGYTGWAGIFAFFFSILIYTSTYLVIVQKSFQLISFLPDRVLRWIGGQPEQLGQETAQWGEETKGKIGEGGKASQEGLGATDKALSGYAQKGIASVRGLGKSGGGSVSAGPSSTPSPPGEGGGSKDKGE